jgi:hypothetical protein
VVALLVGAIGIPNIMVISVLECRGEIGLHQGAGNGSPPHQLPSSWLGRCCSHGSAGWPPCVLNGAEPDLRRSLLRADRRARIDCAVGLAGLYPAAKAARLRPPKRYGRLSESVMDARACGPAESHAAFVNQSQPPSNSDAMDELVFSRSIGQ